MEWSPLQLVTTGSFVIGALFGAIVNKTNFCTMGAVSDWVNFDDKSRLRAWFLAIGIAVIASQSLQFYGVLKLNESIYLTNDFRWLGYLLGGALFGVGMTLASGCGQRSLVRVGGGNLKSLVVVIFLALSAYMTMRGILAPLRVELIESLNIDLQRTGASNQSIGNLLSAVSGMQNAKLLDGVVAATIGGGFIIYALSNAQFRRSFNNVFAGVSIGLIIPAGWYITGVVGFDDFDPLPVESWTFVAPTANALQYLMTFTGATVNFGIAAVGGVICGSFLFAVATGSFRVESFVDRDDMLRHIGGGVLMGFGGVLAMGCTIGQAITGMSTLALGSLMTLVSILFGSALTMKVQYYMLDDLGFFGAIRNALVDLRLAPRGPGEKP